MKHQGSVLLLACLGLGAGCIQPEQSRGGLPVPVVRDSAGIRIVEYPALGPMLPPASSEPVNPLLPQLSQLPSAFRLESKPFLDIGGLDSSDNLEFDTRNPWLSAVQLSNGTIVAKDRTRLMFFAADGSFLRVAGRSGRGPGEFLQTNRLCALNGDTLLVIDQIDQRVSLWSADGQHLQTFARPGDIAAGGCHPEGILVVHEPGQYGGTADSTDRLIAYRLVRPNGATIRQLGTHPGPSLGAESPIPMFAPAAQGWYVGSGRFYEIRYYSETGTLVQIFRLGRRLAPISDREWEHRIDRAVPSNASPQQAADIREGRRVRRPYRYPAYTELRVDPAGRLWVSDFGSDRDWTIFDSTGHILGRFGVGFDAASRKGLAGFGRDYVIIRSTDSDGALHLMFHRIALAEKKQPHQGW